MAKTTTPAGTIRDATPEELQKLGATRAGPGLAATAGVPAAPADVHSLANAPEELRAVIGSIARCETWEHARGALLRLLA